eukprot:6205634-Pleurochrysis_carterae.AAC.7
MRAATHTAQNPDSADDSRRCYGIGHQTGCVQKVRKIGKPVQYTSRSATGPRKALGCDHAIAARSAPSCPGRCRLPQSNPSDDRGSDSIFQRVASLP